MSTVANALLVASVVAAVFALMATAHAALTANDRRLARRDTEWTHHLKEMTR